MPLLDHPFVIIGMDVVGELPTSRSGNKYMYIHHTMCDYATGSYCSSTYRGQLDRQGADGTWAFPRRLWQIKGLTSYLSCSRTSDYLILGISWILGIIVPTPSNWQPGRKIQWHTWSHDEEVYFQKVKAFGYMNGGHSRVHWVLSLWDALWKMVEVTLNCAERDMDWGEVWGDYRGYTLGLDVRAPCGDAHPSQSWHGES